KFENNDVDMVPHLTRLKEAGADAIILVVNAPPGAQMMKSRERMGWTVPVVSHWGISGGRFPELAGPTAGDAHFIQTYSFFGKQSPTGERVLAALKKSIRRSKGPKTFSLLSAQRMPTMPCIFLRWVSSRLARPMPMR